MDAKRLAVALFIFCTLLACSDSAETLPSVSNDPIIVNPTPEPPTVVPTPMPTPTTSPTKSEIVQSEIATMRVLGTRPHDETAFTQGLEFYGDRLFESRGLRGSSGLTEINASDGEVLRDISLAP
ncbi:MAG: glutaminyl-peptide cyclotransferase, partial [Acidimicrobiales bacterium]